MEIRVHGPGQEPAAARGHHAHPGQRLRARRRLLPHRGDPRAVADDLDTVAYCLAGEGEQEYNVVTVTPAAPGRLDARRAPRSSPTPAVASAARRRLDEVERQLSSRSPRADRRPRRWWRRCPSGCAPRRRCSTRPAGSTRPACSPPTAGSSPCAKTSAGTTRSTSSIGHAAARAARCRCPTTCSWCRAGSASRSCRRRRSPGIPVDLRGVGAVEPRGRRGATGSARRSSASCAASAPTSTPTPSASTSAR